MADIGPLFARGVIDSLKVFRGLQDVISSFELVKRTFQITLINGVIYLGSIYLYNFFMRQFFPAGQDPEQGQTQHQDDQSGTLLVGGLYIILKTLMALVYHAWIFIIYIMAMTLNTFWV